LAGMNVVASDLLESRLTLAKKFGARWTMKPASGPENHPGPSKRNRLPVAARNADAAVLAVPSDAALRHALKSLRGGGQVLLFAHTKRGALTDIDLASVCVDEKDLLGSYSADFTLQREVAQIVFSRQLDVRALVSHRFPLTETSAAISLASRPS